MSDTLPLVTFLTTGVLPVPAIEGGAVEGLVETLLKDNELTPRYRFQVVSIWNERAVEASKAYANATFSFLRPPSSVGALDRAAFSVAKHVLRKRNVSAYRYAFERLWYVRAMGRLLASRDFGTLVVENHPSIYLALKEKGNSVRYAGRYFYHLHNEFPDLYGCAEIARGARAVLSISTYIQQSYDRLLGGLGESQKRVFMNCVDFDAYARTFSASEMSSFRLAHGLAEDDFVFMFSGRITPEKGVRELLEGFALAIGKMPRARLMIVGAAFFGSDISSEYETEVRDIALRLGGRVVFTGYVPHEEMSLAYAASDACCFPSVWEEPACLSVLEGMAAGRPVITTRAGGIPEYTGQDNVLLLERGEGLGGRIARAMLSLYENEELRHGLAARGRARAREFDSSDYLDRFTECIGTEVGK